MPARRSVIIALDQGSSSSRALAVESGRVIAQAQRALATYRPRTHFVEHEPADILRTQLAALDDVLARAPKTATIKLAVASQRSTFVLWDRASGEAVCRAPSWQDGRAAEIVARLGVRGDAIRAKTGLFLNPYYSAPKIRWLLENDGRIRRLAGKGGLCAGPVATYLIWNLTGGATFACDPGLAQRMLLMNFKTLRWDDDLLRWFGISRSILPRIIPSEGDWGAARRGGRSLSIRACLGDQQAAAIGLGGHKPGSAVLNYGTGAFFLYNTGARARLVRGLLTSIGWKRPGEKPRYLIEGTVNAAGAAFDWLRDVVGATKKGADLQKLCAQARHRVWIVPAIGGLGAPHWHAKSQPAIFAAGIRTTPADLVRGVADGIAFLISDIVAALREHGLTPRSAQVSGGLSKLDCLLQFQADITGLALRRSARTEATALGAASLAAGAPAGAMRHDRIFRPRLRAGAAQALRAFWQDLIAAVIATGR